MIESEIDHIEDSIASDSGSYSLIDSSEAHSILADNLLGDLPCSRCLLGPKMKYLLHLSEFSLNLKNALLGFICLQGNLNNFKRIDQNRFQDSSG